MAIEITKVLEHFVTHEFITAVELSFWIGRALGIYYSIKGVIGWWLMARSKAAGTMLSQLYGTPPSLNNCIFLMVASSLMWNMGSGIMAFGQLLYGSIAIDVDDPYTAVMFDAVSLNATNLVNQDIMNSRKVTEGGRVTIRACLAVFSMFGYFSYFKGINAIAKLGDPTVKDGLSLSSIIVRCFIGAGLTLIDKAYLLLTTSITQAAAG